MGSVDLPALTGYPKLVGLIEQFEAYLTSEYPEFFGDDKRPTLPVKRAKVIHDNLWGTIRFSWQELALLDTPILQRLRDIHQVGLAFLVYPSARHSRFEHTLGVITLASRTFDALLERNRFLFHDIIKNIDANADIPREILRLKQELRLAALLHDTGHSLFSHASERVFRDLDVLREASKELSAFVGKEKGEGEVISFCLTLTPAVRRFFERVRSRPVIGDQRADDYDGPIDFTNVALLIIGRSRHPHLQFLGDIISSEIDSDKLDYLIRDAIAAGLPLRYDIDMYLYSARLEASILADGEGELQKLYSSLGGSPVKPDFTNGDGDPCFETYRLRLPKKAMHVIEQIVLCKLMLFSYMYHHPKVRAAEGLLERTLQKYVEDLRTRGLNDASILNSFLGLTDSVIYSPGKLLESHPELKGNFFRLRNRLVPREVYRISASEASGAQRGLVSKFLISLQNRLSGKALLQRFEALIGERLCSLKIGTSPREALFVSGVWVDLPKAPKFEDTRNLIVDADLPNESVTAGKLFPIGEWQHAYTHYRYYVRVFAFSEYVEQAAEAAKLAMHSVIGIEDPGFYERIRRKRT